MLRLICDPLQALPSDSSLFPPDLVWTFPLLPQPQCSLGQLRAVAPVGTDGGCCLIPYSALPLLLHGTKLASRSSWNSPLWQSVLANGSRQGGRMEIQGFWAGGCRNQRSNSWGGWETEVLIRRSKLAMCQVWSTGLGRKSEKNHYRTHSRLQPVPWAPSLSESHERQLWVPSQMLPEAAA